MRISPLHGATTSIHTSLGRQILFCTLISLSTHLIFPIDITAISVNITVDDTFGNPDRSIIPTYLPANDTWHAGSPGEQWAICTIKPSELDMDQILGQSWHHATYFLGIPIEMQVTFPGTAVYVYNVVPNFLRNGAITLVNVSFALDGEPVGHFFHAPDSSSEVLYHQLVYANASLADTVHTLVMSASGSEPSLIFFDYLVYTTEVEGTTYTSATASGSISSSNSTTSPPYGPSSVHQPVAVIVGGVVGGLALLLLVAALLCLVLDRRRRRRRRRRSARPLPSRSDYASTDVMIPIPSVPMRTSQSYSRPLSIGLLSNAATVAGETPAPAALASRSDR